MSHFDHSGSEDGQLRSPGDEIILSGDEEGETDSLDIKPPQAATHRDAGGHRRSSNKEKKHSKERKHKDRDRERRDGGQTMMDDRRQPPKYGGNNFDHRNRDRHGNVRTREHYEREYDYHNRHSNKHREREPPTQQHMSDREFLQYEKRKYETGQYNNSRQDAETLEQDLRSRLLSKRNKHAKEYTRYDDQPYHEKKSQLMAGELHEHRNRGGEYKDGKEPVLHKEQRQRVNVIELIDSPEVMADYQSSKKHKKKEKERAVPEDPEKVARRLKLLEAEREMAKRKDAARVELEARREMRRERGEPTKAESSDEKGKKRPYPSGSEKQRKAIKISDDNSPLEEGEADKSEEDSEESSENEEEEEDVTDESDSEKSDDASSQGHSDQHQESPLSIGDLSKSPKRRSHSRSRSHSVRSHSRSERSRSRLETKSRSRSRGSEEQRYRSKSRSPSRSLSRSHSKSVSRSRSRSGTRSEERGMNKAKHVDADDVDMKDDSKDKKPPTDSPAEMDDSPRNDKGEKLPNYYPGIQGCRSVEEFQCLNRIEEGTYGVVYRAKDKRTNEIVALKRLKMEKEKEGFPITSLREINTLLKGQHPNIVTVREIVVGSNMDKIFIVMDYVEHDLKSLMETMKHKEQSFFPGEVKCLAQQLLCAVGHLHDNWILHRDLKTSNLLLSHKGVLKVGDFGLAREYGSPLKHYTSLVVTLWYRAPELLLCTKEYSTPIDMWSVGCIFAEFLQMGPMFPGKSEIDQLNRIFKELGTPNEKIWPGYKELPAVQNLLSQNSQFTEYPVSNLRKRFFKKTTELGMSLLQSMLTYDPKQRFTAEQALKHPYFKEVPLPIDPSMFPTWPAKSELGARKALASSPKPPSGGSQFKQLGRDEIINSKSSGATSSQILTGSKKPAASTGFVLNAGIDQRQMAMGPGFNLKF